MYFERRVHEIRLWCYRRQPAAAEGRWAVRIALAGRKLRAGWIAGQVSRGSITATEASVLLRRSVLLSLPVLSRLIRVLRRSAVPLPLLSVSLLPIVPLVGSGIPRVRVLSSGVSLASPSRFKAVTDLVIASRRRRHGHEPTLATLLQRPHDQEEAKDTGDGCEEQGQASAADALTTVRWPTHLSRQRYRCERRWRGHCHSNSTAAFRVGHEL